MVRRSVLTPVRTIPRSQLKPEDIGRRDPTIVGHGNPIIVGHGDPTLHKALMVRRSVLTPVRTIPRGQLKPEDIGRRDPIIVGHGDPTIVGHGNPTLHCQSVGHRDPTLHIRLYPFPPPQTPLTGKGIVLPSPQEWRHYGSLAGKTGHSEQSRSPRSEMSPIHTPYQAYQKQLQKGISQRNIIRRHRSGGYP